MKKLVIALRAMLNCFTQLILFGSFLLKANMERKKTFFFKQPRWQKNVIKRVYNEEEKF